MNSLYRIEIDLKAQKFSTNKIYSGIHYSQRKKQKDTIGWLIKKALIKNSFKQDHNFKNWPVIFKYRFEWASRPLDCSNCTYMAKIVEDWLIKLGILPDDSPKYVEGMWVESKKGAKNNLILEVLTDGEK